MARLSAFALGRLYNEHGGIKLVAGTLVAFGSTSNGNGVPTRVFRRNPATQTWAYIASANPLGINYGQSLSIDGPPIDEPPDGKYYTTQSQANRNRWNPTTEQIEQGPSPTPPLTFNSASPFAKDIRDPSGLSVVWVPTSSPRYWTYPNAQWTGVNDGSWQWVVSDTLIGFTDTPYTLAPGTTNAAQTLAFSGTYLFRSLGYYWLAGTLIMRDAGGWFTQGNGLARFSSTGDPPDLPTRVTFLVLNASNHIPSFSGSQGNHYAGAALWYPRIPWQGGFIIGTATRNNVQRTQSPFGTVGANRPDCLWMVSSSQVITMLRTLPDFATTFASHLGYRYHAASSRLLDFELRYASASSTSFTLHIFQSTDATTWTELTNHTFTGATANDSLPLSSGVITDDDALYVLQLQLGTASPVVWRMDLSTLVWTSEALTGYTPTSDFQMTHFMRSVPATVMRAFGTIVGI